MSKKVKISESILQDICNEISVRENSTDPIKPIDFVEHIINFPKPGLGIVPGSHCDELGKWHLPDNWDDIESIDLSNKHECYLLFDRHVNTIPYASLKVKGGNEVYWSYGHVVDGEFIIYQGSTRTKVNLNSSKEGTFSLNLIDFTDDCIVIKVEATDYLSYVIPNSYTNTAISSTALPALNNAIVMRYGRFVKGTVLGLKGLYFESDHLVDFAVDHQNTNTVITCSGYGNNYAMQRFRLSGATDLSKNYITTFEGMFTACYLLSDLEDPFNMTGWVTDKCTKINNMFNACFALKSRLIVKNWDFTNITGVAQLFNNCYNLSYIDGTETWNKAKKCNSFKYMFSMCYSLRGDIDLSGLYMGNCGTALVSDGTIGMFQQTRSIHSININNSNWSTITTCASLFNSSSVRTIYWDENFTPPTAITTTASMFSSATGIQELIFDGWNFSSLTNMGNMFNNTYSLKKLVFKNCIPQTTWADTGSSTIPFTYMHNCKYLDISFLDLSVCTGTYMHSAMINASPNIVDFYPPQHIHKNCAINSPAMLSHESLLRVLNNLDTVTTATTLTMGAHNLNRLTDAEKAIATGKGWTLA